VCWYFESLRCFSYFNNSDDALQNINFFGVVVVWQMIGTLASSKQAQGTNEWQWQQESNAKRTSFIRQIVPLGYEFKSNETARWQTKKRNG